MASLGDRLDFVVGAKAADQLDEELGIHTVDDLLRHYPRSYTEGATRWESDDQRPPAGEHITIVDTIVETKTWPMKKTPKKLCHRVTLGAGRNKVTATFFNANYLKKDLTEGTKVMLSGEVGFFKNVMQLTHPDFLILDSPGGRNRGSKSLKTIADASQAVSGEVLMSAFERRFFPIYPASTKLQSWDIFACVRQVLDVRAVASSRRPGFSKNLLRNSLAEEGIDYVHLRALGTPADGRAAARAGRIEDLKRIYAGQLELPEAMAEAAQMVALAAEKPSALLCYEREPGGCHRTLLLKAVAPDAEVVDLFA